LEGDADGQALPFGGLAYGDEVVRLGPRADGALNYGATCSELGDYGDETAFGGGGDSAVGGVVAEPDGIGDGGVEVGQVECGDVTGDAVDEEPGTGLPDPVGDGVGGERVVEAEGAADGEAAVSDVVGVAGGPLFLMVVDEERADFEGGGLVRFGVGGGVGLGVGDATDGAESYSVDFGAGGAEGWSTGAQDGQQEHRSGAEDLHSARVRMRVWDYKVEQANCLLAERILCGIANANGV